MITPSLLVVASLLSASGLEDPVSRAMARARPALTACLDQHAHADVRTTLRFRVSADGRATAIRLDDDSGVPLPLGRCLEAALGGVVFPEEACDADVAYPVRYFHTDAARPATTDPHTATTNARPGPPALAFGRSGNVLGDPWIVTRGGRPLSDLELAGLSGGSMLTAPLLAERRTFTGLAVAEGGLALAGLGLATYGSRDLFRGRGPRAMADSDLGMAGAGLLTAGVAGVLCLYHLLRTTDLTADRPVWHYLSRDQAAALVAGDGER